MITELDVVSACLASMGEAAPNSLDDSNPFIQSALQSLAHSSVSEQSRGWYFNMETIEVRPTVDEEYYVPGDILGLVPGPGPNHIVIRGRKLYDTSAGKPLQGTKVLHARVIRNVPFKDLPYHAQRLVRAATVLFFQQSYDGDEQKINEAKEEHDIARANVNAEHTRSVNVNMLHQGATGNTRHNWYYPQGSTRLMR